MEQTRSRLLRAFVEAGVPARWLEWERGDTSSPPHVCAYGSPTVLVNGKDVAGTAPSENLSCCRLYTGADGGFDGAPSVEIISTALQDAEGDEDGSASKNEDNGRTGWQSSLAVLPGIGASLLPVVICPACWPAYAGLLSSFGLGFLLETAYLLPLTAIFLVIAVTALAYRAGTRRGSGPFVLGLAASAAVLGGKSVLESDTAMYGGLMALIAASLWNAWPRKKAGTGKGSCPACVSSGTDVVMNANGGADKNKEVSP